MWHKLTDNPEHNAQMSQDSTKAKNASKDGKSSSATDKKTGSKDEGKADSKKDDNPKKE